MNGVKKQTFGKPQSAKSPQPVEPRPAAKSRLVSPARRCALDALRRVEEDGAFASAVLATSAAELQANDRALCHEVVMGALRQQSWLDALLKHLAGRDPAKLDREVRRALRAGLYQIRFLTRIPASAVVNETVAHVRANGFTSAAGFANAVLRRAARELEFDPTASISDELERLAVATSHPRFLLERWTQFFGKEAAAAIARANNQSSPTAFRINISHERAAFVLDELAAAGARFIASSLVADAWRIEGANATLRELEAAGAIYIQSEASQLVAHALDAKAGERVLDACAAPGSKATHIATLVHDRALVVAADIHPHRLRLLRRLAARQHLDSIRAVVMDSGAYVLPFQDESFHRVLVDAPCTGTGTLRHNPEILSRINPADITRLAVLQKRILAAAARAVMPGGRLIYSTCSLELEENEEVVANFLSTQPGWRIIEEAVPDALRTATGAARTFPHTHYTDGFFLQVFERA